MGYLQPIAFEIPGQQVSPILGLLFLSCSSCKATVDRVHLGVFPSLKLISPMSTGGISRPLLSPSLMAKPDTRQQSHK